MDVFIKVSILVLTFITAAVGIGGDTWDKQATSIANKLTNRGLLAICCLLLTLAFGIWNEVRSYSADQNLVALIEESARREKDLQARLDEARNVLKVVKYNSDRSRQILCGAQENSGFGCKVLPTDVELQDFTDLYQKIMNEPITKD